MIAVMRRPSRSLRGVWELRNPIIGKELQCQSLGDLRIPWFSPFF